MLKFIDHKKMGRGSHGWLDSHHHFSFANYYNPDNIQFGVLRVVNDDVVAPGTGFDFHPHKDMEIISYVVKGELTHKDNMGNQRTLGRGSVQYMSAGTGVVHGEYNEGREALRFYQIWVLPNKQGVNPNYGDFELPWEDRVNKWMKIVSGDPDAGYPIQFHADLNLQAAELTDGNSLEFKVGPGRQAYLAVLEGTVIVNGITVGPKDAMEIVEEDVTLTGSPAGHFLMFEMEKA